MAQQPCPSNNLNHVKGEWKPFSGHTGTMKITFLIFLSVLYSGLAAQSPCPADLNTVAGKWKQTQDYYNPPFTYKANAGSYDKANAKQVLEQTLELVKQAYPNPIGCNANYDMQFPFAGFNRGLPSGYFLRTGFFNFYCENNSTKEIESTNVWLTVAVNSFVNTWFLSGVAPPQAGPRDNDKKFNADDDENYTISGKTVYAIPAYKSEMRGIEYYAADYPGNNAENAGIQYFIVKNKKIPLFLPVHRQEYVLQFQKELAEYRQIEKNRLQNWIKIAPDDESSKIFLQKFDAFMEKYQRGVDEYLKTASTEELSKPVYDLLPLSPTNTDNPEVEFTDYGKKQVVYFNEKYMDVKLKADKPQFMVVELRAERDEGDARFKWRWELRETFNNVLNLEELRKLLIP